MSKHFCTISTASHLYKCYTLFDTLYEQSKDSYLHILVIDIDNPTKVEPPFKEISVYSLDSIKEVSFSKEIIGKYLKSSDKLRWSLKPIFLQKILQSDLIDKVIYVDNDIAFFGDYNFLFEDLKKHNILLTPHNYPRDPLNNQNWLEANFRVGLYNAGFFGANVNAISTLEWWAKCCLYRCEKNYFRGLFDDQKYLDLVPVIDSNTKVLKHKGCNLAGWNLSICERSLEDNEVKIDNEWNVVFIHFNPITISCFLEGKDPYLKLFFDDYLKLLLKYNPNFDLNQIRKKSSIIENAKLNVWKFLDWLN